MEVWLQHLQAEHNRKTERVPGLNQARLAVTRMMELSQAAR